MNNLIKRQPDNDLVLTRFLYAKDEVFSLCLPQF